MKRNLFTQDPTFFSNLAEIEISYRPKVKASERKKVVTSSDAYDCMKGCFPSLEYREYFVILCLNRNNGVLGYCMISMGGMTGTVVDVRLIMQAALKANACSLVLAHNHPSGNLVPSEADKVITRKVKEAGKVLDITVLDHLIVTDETYFSFADEGLI